MMWLLCAMLVAAVASSREPKKRTPSPHVTKAPTNKPSALALSPLRQSEKADAPLAKRSAQAHGVPYAQAHARSHTQAHLAFAECVCPKTKRDDRMNE